MRFFRHLLSVPIIWIVVIPTIFLHLVVAFYQNTCFPLYGVKRVRFLDYIAFDRAKLRYLRWYDKLNCGYCTYANGVFSYAQEIGRRTEYYWCGIKHESQPDNPAFVYQDKFAAYGDKEAYERHLKDVGRIEG